MLSTLYHLIGHTIAIVNRDVCHVGKNDKNKLFYKNSLVESKKYDLKHTYYI